MNDVDVIVDAVFALIISIAHGRTGHMKEFPMRLISGRKEGVGYRSESSPRAGIEPESPGFLLWNFLKIGSLAFTGVLLGSRLCGRRPAQPLGAGIVAILAVSRAQLL